MTRHRVLILLSVLLIASLMLTACPECQQPKATRRPPLLCLMDW